MNDTFMKEKPILPLLTSMAFPMVISMLVGSLYNIVDSFFVAQISEKAMTALSLVFPVQNFINAVSIGYGIGINALIAFSLGAGNKSKASLTATQGLLFSAIHGILIMAVCIPVMPAFLRLFTSDDTVIALGVRYSAIAFLFSPIIMVGLSFEKIFQSVGRMKIAMISMLCGCISNIILDPLLIFGIGFLPEMGISGAAIATGIGQVITLGIYLIMYVVHPIPVHFSRKYLAFNKSVDIQLYAIGIPAMLNLALPSLLISFLNAILSMYSQSYVVILGIYYKLQTFLYLPANGIVQGMRPILSYNYGAGEKRRMNRIIQICSVMILVIMAAGMLLFLLVPGIIMKLFTADAVTIREGSAALRIISLGFVVSGVSVICSGALEALGKGFASFLISLLRYLALIVPAAWLGIQIAGVTGIWTAFPVAEFLTAIAAAVIFAVIYHKNVSSIPS